MIYRFADWMEHRKVIKEESDPFLSLQQKEGDFIYFGIHDLAKSYNQNGSLPSLNVDTIMKKIGQCVDADPVEQTVKVYSEKDPYHFGYHKLETKASRDKRKPKVSELEGTHELNLPISSLQDITHLFSDGELDGHKIWLVIDGNAKSQQNLMKEIRKKEFSKSAHPKEAEEDTPFEISDNTRFTRNSRYFKQFNDNKDYGYKSIEVPAGCTCGCKGGCWPCCACGRACGPFRS